MLLGGCGVVWVRAAEEEESAVEDSSGAVS